MKGRADRQSTRFRLSVFLYLCNSHPGPPGSRVGETARCGREGTVVQPRRPLGDAVVRSVHTCGGNQRCMRSTPPPLLSPPAIPEPRRTEAKVCANRQRDPALTVEMFRRTPERATSGLNSARERRPRPPRSAVSGWNSKTSRRCSSSSAPPSMPTSRLHFRPKTHHHSGSP